MNLRKRSAAGICISMFVVPLLFTSCAYQDCLSTSFGSYSEGCGSFDAETMKEITRDGYEYQKKYLDE
ncbi:MAG: hypothetical protein K1000chlam4_00012 [Chlamydiae bacterium]|nr:hypothetical protein [Chlamydiota bacterium]